MDAATVVDFHFEAAVVAAEASGGDEGDGRGDDRAGDDAGDVGGCGADEADDEAGAAGEDCVLFGVGQGDVDPGAESNDGVDLARRADGATVHALTVPLVTSSDGQKLGKSTGGGSVWLDPDLTSPTAWHDYFLHTSDADVIRYLKWFTFRSRDEIAELDTLTATKPHLHAAQHALAADLTALVHAENSHTA